jgi:ATP-binding cassette, subfamily F, member 3
VDLPAIAWLTRFLAQTPLIALIVSHDRSFLDAVCTDIVLYRDLTLTYSAGSYSEYERQRDEMGQRTRNALDARQRRESHIQKSIDSANSRYFVNDRCFALCPTCSLCSTLTEETTAP